MNKNEQKMNTVSCYRPDGSFDFKAFFLAPQVIAGFLFIAVSLGACYLVTNVLTFSNEFIGALLMMFCALSCFSGANTILQFLAVQREMNHKG